VLSLLMVLLGTLYPLGSVLQGAIADRVGLRVTTAGAAVLMAAALLLVRMLRPDLANALDEPERSGLEEGSDAGAGERDGADRLDHNESAELVVPGERAGDGIGNEQTSSTKRSN